MKVGIVIGRIGGIDGVALETEKWIEVMEERLGCEVFIITGKLERPMKNTTILPELDFHHPLTVYEQNSAFFHQNVEENYFVDFLIKQSMFLEREILAWIVKNKIDVLLSENASALPSHLSMGLAVKNIAEKTKMPVVTHDHDFYWERGDRYKTKYKRLREIIDECFPISLKNVHHAVINKYGKETLKKRIGADSTVVPNVMDFSKPYGMVDSYNKTLRKSLKLNSDDILLFQITRIVRRKGIETAIDLVKKLDDPRIKLIITGSADDDSFREYYSELVERVIKSNLQSQVLFRPEFFDNFRSRQRKDKSLSTLNKIYSLSDAYAHADACTYFSKYEGFGNAFVEAVLAKKPIFVNNYEPVYMPDIGSLGFKTVMTNNNKLTDKHVSEIREILKDKKMQKDIAEFNYKLGKKYFSYDVLEKKLRKLFN